MKAQKGLTPAAALRTGISPEVNFVLQNGGAGCDSPPGEGEFRYTYLMLEITPSLKLDESELQFDFIRSAGPGGQNVNKVATAAQLRWDVRATVVLPPDVKDRLVKLAGSRMTEEGVLIIEARRYRTQEQNRLDAIQRLIALVQKALVEPKQRKKTRPSITSSAARVDEKKRRGAVKRTRRYNPADWE